MRLPRKNNGDIDIKDKGHQPRVDNKYSLFSPSPASCIDTTAPRIHNPDLYDHKSMISQFERQLRISSLPHEFFRVTIRKKLYRSWGDVYILSFLPNHSYLVQKNPGIITSTSLYQCQAIHNTKLINPSDFPAALLLDSKTQIKV